MKHFGGQRIDPEVARRMTDALVHRGPDHGDVYHEPHIAFGHRRLSVIDLASGSQPMFNEDRNVCVVFNGEIYNFKELRQELTTLGHTFSTKSDTEVIVHGWEQWGIDCTQHFRGMFAFVLWDKRQKRAFMARDRLGVKPLYYALLPNGHLIFGSELKALEIHPDFKREIDPAAVEDYLSLGYVPDPKTIYLGARKLESAHHLDIKVGHPFPAEVQYWRLNYQKVVRDHTEVMSQLKANIEEAVRIRMVADVPLGAFLSGGVDSSVVVATMAGLMPNEGIKTCSIGFNEKDYDESQYAGMVAERHHTDHINQLVSLSDLDDLNTVFDQYDEPFADNSALATYRVCKLARSRVTVALSGDGGDETFGGYRRYRMHVGEERVRSLMPLGVRSVVFGALGALYPKADWLPQPLRAKTTLQSIASTSHEAYFRSVSAIRPDILDGLREASFSKTLQGYRTSQLFAHHASSFKGEDPLDLIQHLDLKTWLSGGINVKVDRASMAHSLEVREPLLDHKLMEWAATLPQSLKTTPTESKIILKELAESCMPSAALHRPKQGFSMPVDDWFKSTLGDQMAEALKEPGNPLFEYLKRDRLDSMLQSHRSGVTLNGRPLWTVFAFNRFLKRINRTGAS